MREDHDFQRVLYESLGKKALLEYQSIPFVKICIAHMSDNAPIETVSICDQRMFNNAVYYISTVDVEHIVVAIAEKTPLVSYMCGSGDEDGIEVVLFFRARGGQFSIRQFFIENDQKIATPRDLPEGISREKYHEDCKETYRYLTGVNSYLCQVPGHVVRVDPVAKPQRKNKKPWVRRDLPSYLVIDPAIKKERERHGISTPHGSPRPHHRRGHWARLKSPRYKSKQGQMVWVRPAWIGDSEWRHNGSVYSVVTSATG